MKRSIRNTIVGIFLFVFCLWPEISFAAEQGRALDLTQHWAGVVALGLFIVAYLLVIFEESLHLRKSKPLMVVAGVIWILVAIAYGQQGRGAEAAEILRHNLLEFAELLLFLLSAMTYINTIKERNVFDVLRVKLTSMGLSLRGVFWLTGVLAFFMSPVADNLTTALVMGAVVVAVGVGHPKFIAVSCINIVVAANSGGAFSPFGDITTLMVWQRGILPFWDFFALFVPSAVSWLIPAFLMSLTIPRLKPTVEKSQVKLKSGSLIVVGLFLLTISMTVALQHMLSVPPFLGMMTGLGFLKVYGFFIHKREAETFVPLSLSDNENFKPAKKPFDIFVSMKRVEWDTLMFFYGVLLCVGGLGALGYLAVMANFLYSGFGPTIANVTVGGLSAVLDNIPLMFAVLNMHLDMNEGQWLLVTLTTGIGGSMLSIGSAAGVALMGQARGVYTFMSHLKWTWAVALGYAAAVGAHMMLNMG